MRKAFILFLLFLFVTSAAFAEKPPRMEFEWQGNFEVRVTKQSQRLVLHADPWMTWAVNTICENPKPPSGGRCARVEPSSGISSGGTKTATLWDLNIYTNDQVNRLADVSEEIDIVMRGGRIIITLPRPLEWGVPQTEKGAFGIASRVTVAIQPSNPAL